MSRYDGLIIPRSYNDYFSRSRPDDMKQFIRTITQSTVDPAGTDPVNGTAVNGALSEQGLINVPSYNNAVTSIDLNTKFLTDNKIKFAYTINATNSPSGSSEKWLLIKTIPYGANYTKYSIQKAQSMSSNEEWIRYLNNGTWSEWGKIATETDVKSEYKFYPFGAATYTLTEFVAKVNELYGVTDKPISFILPYDYSVSVIITEISTARLIDCIITVAKASGHTMIKVQGSVNKLAINSYNSGWRVENI